MFGVKSSGLMIKKKLGEEICYKTTYIKKKTPLY